MGDDIFAPKQWCEVCLSPAEDVEPARLRGKPLVMVCQQCLRLFPKRVKAQWGNEPFKYFWDLGSAPLALVANRSHRAGQRWYELSGPSEVVAQLVASLRAAGYVIQKEVQYEDSI